MKVVFDLDGTLANCEARVAKYLGQKPNVDWDGFFAACPTDEPIEHAIEVASALNGAGHDVCIWSGRSDAVRDATIEWLKRHRLGWLMSDKLVMRKVGDHRRDDIVKAEWIAEYGKPDLIFEDRATVVAKWRELGVPCYHVAPGDF